MSPPSKGHRNRATVLVALRACRTPKEISKFFNIPKSTVYAIRKRYAAKQKRVDHLHGGDARMETTPLSAARKTRIGPGKKRMRPLIRKVKRIISLNPRKSMRSIARQGNVSPRTLTRIVHQDLGLKSYVLCVKQLLTKEMKKKRVEHGKRLLNSELWYVVRDTLAKHFIKK